MSLTFGLVLNNLHRWLSDPGFDIARTRPVTIRQGKSDVPEADAAVPKRLPELHSSLTPPPITQTLPPKIIHHQAVTKFQDVLRHVHTEVELKTLTEDIDALM